MQQNTFYVGIFNRGDILFYGNFNFLSTSITFCVVSNDRFRYKNEVRKRSGQSNVFTGNEYFFEYKLEFKVDRTSVAL